MVLIRKSKSGVQKQPLEVFCKKRVLRNFAKFTGKHLCQRLFFNKIAGRPAILLRKSLWHRCFPVNFAKFLRTLFLKNIHEYCFRRLLTIQTDHIPLLGMIGEHKGISVTSAARI